MVPPMIRVYINYLTQQILYKISIKNGNKILVSMQTLSATINCVMGVTEAANTSTSMTQWHNLS